MATAQDLLDTLRQLCGDVGANSISDAIGVSLLNQAQDLLSSEVEFLTAEDALAAVQNNPFITLPTDFVRLHNAGWKTFIRELDIGEERVLEDNISSFPASSYGTPTIAFIESVQGSPSQRLRLWPAPSSADPSSTLNGAVTAADATLTLAAVTNFEAPGIALCQSEKIFFGAVSSTSSQLQKCVRGYAGTTAATHVDTTAISQLSLILRYSRVPTALSASGLTATAEWPARFRTTLVNFAAYLYYQAIEDTERAAFHLQVAAAGMSTLAADYALRHNRQSARLRRHLTAITSGRPPFLQGY